jgi:ABC-type oligopeptide transport system substrate-binding subunit
MKARRLKALGFTLLGSLALLFAGCQQQAQAPQPGQPTTVAVEGIYGPDTITPVNPNNVAGLVIVRAKVVLGSVVPDKIQFLLDDTVEYEVPSGPPLKVCVPSRLRTLLSGD